MQQCHQESPRSVIPHPSIHVFQLQPACSATSQHFHLPPCYESHELTVNISLNTTNLNIINISSPEFRIWQHLEDHRNRTLLHHLVNIPSVPTDKLYQQMVNSNRPINPFLSTDESIGDTVSIWTLFSHAGVYAMAIGSLYTSRIRDILLLLLLVPTYQISMLTFTIRFYMVYYCRWQCRGSTHLQMWWWGWTAIVQPCKNHVLHIEWEPTQRVDRSNRYSQKQFLHPDHWI